MYDWQLTSDLITCQILISLSQNLVQLLYMVLSTLYEMYRKCKFPCMCHLAFIHYTLILVINASAEVLRGCNSMILEMTRLKFDFHVQARVYDPHFVKGSSLTQSRFSLIITEFVLSLQFKWKHKHLQNNFKQLQRTNNPEQSCLNMIDKKKG